MHILQNSVCQASRTQYPKKNSFFDTSDYLHSADSLKKDFWRFLRFGILSFQVETGRNSV